MNRCCMANRQHSFMFNVGLKVTALGISFTGAAVPAESKAKEGEATGRKTELTSRNHHVSTTDGAMARTRHFTRTVVSWIRMPRWQGRCHRPSFAWEGGCKEIDNLHGDEGVRAA